MPRGQSKVSKEIKEQILKRIRDEGIPVSKVAAEHGIPTNTIYTWLSKTISQTPSILEVARLRRENQLLKELLGQNALEMSVAKKKNEYS
jgi:transposase-like protein